MWHKDRKDDLCLERLSDIVTRWASYVDEQFQKVTVAYQSCQRSDLISNRLFGTHRGSLSDVLSCLPCVGHVRDETGGQLTATDKRQPESLPASWIERMSEGEPAGSSKLAPLFLSTLQAAAAGVSLTRQASMKSKSDSGYRQRYDARDALAVAGFKVDAFCL